MPSPHSTVRVLTTLRSDRLHLAQTTSAAVPCHARRWSSRPPVSTHPGCHRLLNHYACSTSHAPNRGRLGGHQRSLPLNDLRGISLNARCARDYLSRPRLNPSCEPLSSAKARPLVPSRLRSVRPGHRSSEFSAGKRTPALPYFSVWRHASTALLSAFPSPRAGPTAPPQCSRVPGASPADELQHHRLPPPPMLHRGWPAQVGFSPRRPTKWIAHCWDRPSALAGIDRRL
jgi:hypothetical protein